MQDVGCGMRDAGCGITNVKAGWRQAGSWLFSWRDAGIIDFFVQETGCKTVEIR